MNNRKLRLIDTSAINEKKFESIPAYIAQFEYLNGICILLKPDESRLQNYLDICLLTLKQILRFHFQEKMRFASIMKLFDFRHYTKIELNSAQKENRVGG